jgi:hypothetical protein
MDAGFIPGEIVTFAFDPVLNTTFWVPSEVKVVAAPVQFASVTFQSPLKVFQVSVWPCTLAAPSPTAARTERAKAERLMAFRGCFECFNIFMLLVLFGRIFDDRTGCKRKSALSSQSAPRPFPRIIALAY